MHITRPRNVLLIPLAADKMWAIICNPSYLQDFTAEALHAPARPPRPLTASDVQEHGYRHSATLSPEAAFCPIRKENRDPLTSAPQEPAFIKRMK
ncbi:hypothetical protein EYF80_049715 [Liparis tanakae]|uniref:Uncharacterized protein n=1 Tax=Liparis tanakae TaxID=230148 RepID=A0A4Z2FGP9_9TELE|nr:hypothetical protein EYF80_049715 [Liparis tanakae]